MPSNKAIKRRIAGVNTTKKIMKAMNMVAAAKLQKIRTRLTVSRPLFAESVRIMDKIRGCESAAGNLFVAGRNAAGSAVYTVITGDKGLCGPFCNTPFRAGGNHSLCKAAFFLSVLFSPAQIRHVVCRKVTGLRGKIPA